MSTRVKTNAQTFQSERSTSVNSDEAEILRLIEDQAEAIRSKNADAALGPYAPEIVKFDLAPPLQYAGPEALDSQGIEAWFDTWDGAIGIELRDFSVTAGEDLAFCHGLIRISGTKIDSGEASVWTRATMCLRRTSARWKIVHEHSSVPFYMDGSLRAATDLAP